MRCSSCELLLDHYLEGALRPRKAVEIATHVAECRRCAALLEELRVIDGLLITVRPPGQITPDFTKAVVYATAAAPPRPARRISFFTASISYLVAAWALAAFTLARDGGVATVGALVASGQQGLAAAGAAVRALAPAAPLAAAAVAGVLLLDLLLVFALIYGYRRFRTAPAPHVIRGFHS